MALVDSTDPAAGDSADYNRSPGDGKHRSHRFAAANMLMPKVLKLEGWEEQLSHVERWLQGKYEIPEIRDKWAEGPIVQLALDVPQSIQPGEQIPVRVILTSNKVGHDYPTGPLDIIQSWIELRVEDEKGNVVFASGRRDEKNFIEPGSFLFKAEPVDQYGNLIDRHNLWEMVGVRYRRALFPGYSDTAEYMVACPSGLVPPPARAGAAAQPGVEKFDVPARKGTGTYHVIAILEYRKVDQFLLNFLFGEKSGITAPVTEIARVSADVRVEVKRAGGVPIPDEPGAGLPGGAF
jgi:hypothetical protein